MLQNKATIVVLKRFACAVGSAASASTQAQPAKTQHHAPHKPHRQHAELKMTRFPSNGLMITTLDTGRPVSRMAMVFRAGSRYEIWPEQRGVAHRLRNCFGLGTTKSSQIGLLWRAGAIGSNMHATLTRDYLFLEIDCLRDYASEALSVLGEASCQPAFKQWELEDSDEAVRFETAQMKENTVSRAMQLLHKAAYRHGGLGNPLWCPVGLAGSLKEEILSQFAHQHIVSGEAALVGLDVDHELMLSYAGDNLVIKNAKAHPVNPSKFLGGEVRKETGSTLAHVMLATEGAGIQDAKRLAVLTVLAGVLGTGPYIKWTETSGQGRLPKAVKNRIQDHPFTTSTFTVSHSDEGLFGIYTVAEASKMGDALKAVVHEFKELASNGISEDDLKRAKAQARNTLLFHMEDGQNVVEDLAVQTLASGIVYSQEDLVDMLTNVTRADVQQAAKKMITSKVCMSAIGGLSGTPYIDDLW